MKSIRHLLILIALVGLLPPVFAQPPPSAAAVEAQLTNIRSRIKAKLAVGELNEAYLAPELAEFDAMLDQQRGEKTEAAARILYCKAIIYAEVLKNRDKGFSLLQRVKDDYPRSETAKLADRIRSSLESQDAAMARAAQAAQTAQAAKTSASADTAPAGLSTDRQVDADLNAIIGRIKDRVTTGQPGQATEASLATELSELNALLIRHQGEKSEAVSHILISKGVIYTQVLGDSVKGFAFLRQVKTDYPGTEGARNAERIIASYEAQAKIQAAQAALVGRPAPGLKFLWTSRGGAKSLADLRGKVVVLDFWATWSRPNLAAFPQVAELAAHYAGCDVEVVGVTSLQGRVENLASKPLDCQGSPAKELELLPIFMGSKNMTWTVAVAEEKIPAASYAMPGLPGMAIIAPDGTLRHLGLNPAAPLAGKAALIDAILTEFKLKLPARG